MFADDDCGSDPLRGQFALTRGSVDNDLILRLEGKKFLQSVMFYSVLRLYLVDYGTDEGCCFFEELAPVFEVLPQIYSFIQEVWVLNH